MAGIAGSVRHLWAAVIVRLEMMGLPAETAPAILAAIAIGILIARYRYAKRRSADETADEPTHGAVRSTLATSSPTHTGGGETGGGDDTVATARTIEGYCDAAHWRCTRNDDVVHMKFPGANDTEQIVFVNSFPSIVEVVSLLPFSYVDLDDAPHDLSNTLMKLNASRKSAFWAIYDSGKITITVSSTTFRSPD